MFILILLCYSTESFAAENDSINVEHIDGYVINPAYGDIKSDELTSSLDESSPIQQYNGRSSYILAPTDENPLSYDELISTLRAEMIERQISIPISFVSNKKLNNKVLLEILNEVYSDFSSPVSGDYLQYHVKGCGYNGKLISYKNTYTFTGTFTVNYYSTHNEEVAVSSAVSSLIQELNLNNLPDPYTKVKAIYDYITVNISYNHVIDQTSDATHLSSDNPELFSAYGALFNKTCVCQGYTNLFYRLTNECGIPSRIIAGEANSERHTWNIVQIGGVYYNVDPTWDAGNLTDEYCYFLKGNANNDFPSHKRDSRYSTPEFEEACSMSSTSFVDIDSFVTRLYQNVLGRDASWNEKQYWINKVASSELTGSEIAYGFFFSQELTNHSLSDSEFVDLLYTTMLDRQADTDGKDNWLHILQIGCSRLYVFKGFAESEEFQNICNYYNVICGSVAIIEARDMNPTVTALVSRQYEKTLNREYDIEGLNTWCERILSKSWTKFEVITNGFFHSQEFINRDLTHEDYVTTLYQSLFDREPDIAGYNKWVSELNDNSKTHDEVLYSFTESEEFNIYKP